MRRETNEEEDEPRKAHGVHLPLGAVHCDTNVLRGLSGATVRATQRPTDITIQDYLKRSYLELFEIAPELNVTAADAKQVEQRLKDAAKTCVKKTCVKRFKEKEDVYEDELKEARKRLRKDTGTLSDEERQIRHAAFSIGAPSRSGRASWPITPSRSPTTTGSPS